LLKEINNFVKTAILLSGEIRNGIDIFNNLKMFFFDYIDCDVYIHSYQCEHSDKILNLYKPKKCVFEDQKSINLNKDLEKYTNKAGETNVLNCFSMWRKRKLVFELIDNFYDVVYVSRLDCYGNKPLKEFLNKEELNIPYGGDYGGVLDLMAWGSLEDIKYYTSLFEKIDEYYNDGKGVRFHPETLLAHHLKQNPSIKINRVPLKITLRGRVFN
jgi:hypothetical protein